jgi:hypothetical protein
MYSQAPTEERDCGTLEIGVDAYYEIATGLLDNGNFGGRWF